MNEKKKSTFGKIFEIPWVENGPVRTGRHALTVRPKWMTLVSQARERLNAQV